MVRRGTTLPLGQPLSHTPPGPASRHSPPLSAHILQLYKDCVAKGIRAKLVFETRGGEEEYSFFCSPQPEAATTAAATTAAAGCSHRQGKKKKRPPNKRRRERARRRWEAWIERRNLSSPSSNTAISTTAAACTAAAVDMTAAADTAAVTSSAAAKRAAAAPATTPTARISAAVPATTSAATTADVVMGTAVRVKAVATTAAALPEQSKLSAGVRRSPARASILDQRRSSVVSDTQESPEKIRDEDNMNKSFRIDFEDDDLQQEDLTCSSCLSKHLCLFVVGKFWNRNTLVPHPGKDSRVNPACQNMSLYILSDNLMFSVNYM
jgi:hypothetical protein